MKRLLTFVLALASCTLALHAQAVSLQETQEDSVINVIAYYCKGDTMKYTYTDAVYKIAGTDTSTISYYTRDCMIVVTDSTSKGYKMEFTPMAVKVDTTSSTETFETKLNLAILEAFDNIKIKFHTDVLGTIESVDNWREVRELFLKGTRKALDKFYGDEPGIDSFMPRKRFENAIALSVSNEASVRRCIEELPLLFDLHGNQVKLGVIDETDSTSSIYPTHTKAIVTYMEDEEGTKGDYEIYSSSITRIPPEATAQLVSTVFQSLFSGELAEKGEAFLRDSLASYLNHDSMKVEQLEKYDFFINGWPARMQTMKSSGIPAHRKVEYKDIEWYYRVWKGYRMTDNDADKKDI